MIKYTHDSLQEAVSKSQSFADVARYFGIAPHGGSQAHLKYRIDKESIDTSHFKSRAWSKGRIFSNRRKPPEEVLVEMPIGSNRTHADILRRSLIEIGRKEECYKCGIGPKWNDTKLSLEVHHKDGNYRNNKDDNLDFICPNCHSQTDNYKAKNKESRQMLACCACFENKSG